MSRTQGLEAQRPGFKSQFYLELTSQKLCDLGVIMLFPGGCQGEEKIIITAAFQQALTRCQQPYTHFTHLPHLTLFTFP